MKFRNPWIDPRVTQVRSGDARAYLQRRGWRPLPVEQPHLLPFESPSGGDDAPVVVLPEREGGRDFTQRIIELISDVALAEGRFAGDILNEMIGQTAAALPPTANGPGVTHPAEATTK